MHLLLILKNFFTMLNHGFDVFFVAFANRYSNNRNIKLVLYQMIMDNYSKKIMLESSLTSLAFENFQFNMKESYKAYWCGDGI
jgi:hypothetical protein